MKITLPFPSRRRAPAEEEPDTPRRSRWPLLLAALALASLGLAAAIGRPWEQPGGATQAPAVPVTKDDLVITVEGSGALQPGRSVTLPARAAGEVREVLVKPGQAVRAGQVLAQLDDRALQIALREAEAARQSAQIKLSQAQRGDATPQELAGAQASLREAEAALAETRGSLASDLRQAEADLRAAQARLDALRNPTPDRLSTAQRTLTEAQAGLEQARNDRSAAKTRAELALEQAVSALTQAQSRYATAKQQWDYAQGTGNDPVQPSTAGANGRQVDNKLSDGQRQQYYDAYVQAEAALRSAESAVEQARVAFDSARQEEAVAIREQEARAADAQTQLDALLSPSNEDVTEAQASLVQARTQLDKLRGSSGDAQIIQAEARVDSARAALEALTAPASDLDLQAAQAVLAQAEAGLDKARLDLEQAQLRAPFDGVVSTVGLTPGATVAAGADAFTLIDTSSSYIDLEISEEDIARISIGQPASVTFDALPETTLSGTVELIAPAATSGQDVVSYQVRVAVAGAEQARPGMSATAQIEVERRPQVLQVPNRALSGRGPQRTLKVQTSGGVAEIEVEVGATNGALTEVVSCPQIGRQCLREGDQVLLNIPTGGATTGQPEGNVRTFSAVPAGGSSGGPAKRVIIEGP